MLQDKGIVLLAKENWRLVQGRKKALKDIKTIGTCFTWQKTNPSTRIWMALLRHQQGGMEEDT